MRTIELQEDGEVPEDIGQENEAPVGEPVTDLSAEKPQDSAQAPESKANVDDEDETF